MERQPTLTRKEHCKFEGLHTVVNEPTKHSRPERLRSIAVRFELDPDTVLDNVMFARAYTSEHQMELINLLASKFAEEKGCYRLLVY